MMPDDDKQYFDRQSVEYLDGYSDASNDAIEWLSKATDCKTTLKVHLEGLEKLADKLIEYKNYTLKKMLEKEKSPN